jgi:GeoRSP system SPASM domain protein
MNLAELSSPIRMYWDIDASGSLTLQDCRGIAREILANKFLILQITLSEESSSEACFAALGELQGASIASSVVAPLRVLTPEFISGLGQARVKVLFAQTDQFADLPSVAQLSAGSGAPLLGISFPVSRANYPALPELLLFCVSNKINHLLLPMQRLFAGEDCFVISRSELKELAARLGSIKIPSSFKITIHDPFLWRAFYPSAEFPNGGCQAANTMLFISPKADVYACPMLPISIGSMRERSLKEIIQSPGKKELRHRILAAPHRCRVCDELDRCKGGCRGRAYSATGSFDGQDPACK